MTVNTPSYISLPFMPPPPVYPVTNSCGLSLKVVCTVWFVTSVQVSGLLYISESTMDMFTFELHWSEFISSLLKNTE